MPGNLRRPRDMVWLHQISYLSVSVFGLGAGSGASDLTRTDSNELSAFTERWFPRVGE